MDYVMLLPVPASYVEYFNAHIIVGYYDYIETWHFRHFCGHLNLLPAGLYLKSSFRFSHLHPFHMFPTIFLANLFLSWHLLCAIHSLYLHFVSYQFHHPLEAHLCYFCPIDLLSNQRPTFGPTK